MGDGAGLATFLQHLIDGLTLGAIYGLVAIGYTMVYGIIRMINFAHGEIYMLGAFVGIGGFTLLSALGVQSVALGLLAVLALSVLFTAAYGWTVERVAYRPLRGAPKLAPLISAIGMSIFLQNYIMLTQGARPKPLQPVLTGSLTLWQGDGFDVSITAIKAFIILLTLVLMVSFTLLIARTPLGRAQRACEQDRTMAALLGIDVDRTISLTFVMGAGLAAVAGVLVTMYYGVIDFYIGFLAGLKAFTAAVLGGIGSLPGAMLGGVLMGLIEAFFTGYADATVNGLCALLGIEYQSSGLSAYKDVAAFSILILVLVFRPTGLLGRPDIEKV
jgi:branched-chain amino acid transport system permease protein